MHPPRRRQVRGVAVDGPVRDPVDRHGRRSPVELADLHVAEPHVVDVTVVLQPHVTPGEVPLRVGADEIVDQRAVEVHLDPLTTDHDLVGVPLPRRVERGVAGLDVGRLEVVDGPGRVLRCVRGVDLDLVPLVHGHPRVVARIREAHEHAGVVVSGHLPVQLEAVGAELLLVPEQPHPADRAHRAVTGVLERTGTGLPPAVETARRPVEEHPVALVRGRGFALRRGLRHGHAVAGEPQLVHVEQSSGPGAAEHQVQRRGITRISDGDGVEVDVGVVATGVRHLGGVHHRAVRGAVPQFDGAARPAGGHAVADGVDPGEVRRIDPDPVPVVDVADPLPAPGAVRGDHLDALVGVEELGLLHLRLQHHLVRAGQRGNLPGPAGVGVADVEHPEDVGVESVSLVRGGLDHAGTPGGLGQRVPVPVVAEDVLDVDPGTVDLPVLRVGHRHLERHLVTEPEESTLGRCLQGHGRFGVADGDDHARRAGEPGPVGDRQPRRVPPVVGVGVRHRARLGGVGLPVPVEVPGVGQLSPVRVAGAGRVEGDLQRRLPGGVLRRQGHLRGAVARGVVDPVDGRVRRPAEVAAAVVEHVQRPVRAELDVHRPGQLHRGEERLDRSRLPVRSDLDRVDPAPVPLVGEVLPVVELGELRDRVELRVEVVDRPAHRRFPAVAELRHRATVVRDPRGLRGRQFGAAGVVRAVVPRGRAVELGTRLTRGEVVVVVGLVVPDAVGPPVVAGPGDQVELHRARGAALRVRRPGVRSVVAQMDPAGLVVDGEPERVAQAHRVDLRAGVVRTRFEEVALRDGVATVLVHGDPQQFAAQVVGVGRAALGVERGVAVGALVERAVAVRGERVRIVAGGQQQIPVRVEVDLTARVAADAPVGLDPHDLLFTGQIQGSGVGQLEAGQLVVPLERREVLGGAGLRRVPGRGVQRGRVVQVHPPVRREVRVDGDALQPVLVVVVDVEFGRQRRAALRCRQEHPAVARGVQHPAVRQDTQGHRFPGGVGALREGDLVEVVVGRLPTRVAGGGTVRVGESGGVADAARQVAEERGFVVGRLGVSPAGVPGASALILVAPRDRVIVAHRARAGVVAALVEGGQHPHVLSRVLPVVVPLVGTGPLLGKVRCGRMVVVLDERGGFLDVRVGIEPGTHQVAVPRPVVLGVRGRVHTGVPAAVGDVALERRLLVGVEYVARGGQPHHRVVVVEVVVGEGGRVLGGVHREPVFRAQILDRRDPRGDRAVPVPRRLGEDEHARLLCRGRALGCTVGRGGECRSRPAQNGAEREHRRPDPPSAAWGRASVAGPAASLHWYLLPSACQPVVPSVPGVLPPPVPPSPARPMPCRGRHRRPRAVSGTAARCRVVSGARAPVRPGRTPSPRPRCAAPPPARPGPAGRHRSPAPGACPWRAR